LKRILLVNPWIEDVAAYDYWLKPLGLLYISAMLRNAGIETLLVDCLDRHDHELRQFTGKTPVDRYFGTGQFYSEVIPKPHCLLEVPRRFKRYGFPVELFRKKIRDTLDVDAVFVTSMMTYWHYGVSECISVIRQEKPGIPVVLGGVYASIMPEHAEQHSGADAVFPGTGVRPVQQALDYIGINKELESNWLDALEPYYGHYQELSYAVVITNTGCPYKCSYCASWKLWDGFSQMQADHAAGIIGNLLQERLIKDIAFFDDALLVGDRFKSLLQILRERGTSSRFHLPNGIHTRLMDKELAALFRDCNFKTINLALESVNENVQRITGEKVSSSDLARAVEFLKDEGFGPKEINVYIIADLPGQSSCDVKRAITLCASLGVVPKINELTPIPGTPLWKDLVASGIIPDGVDPVMLNNSVFPHWWKNGLSLVELQELKDMAHEVKEELLSD